MKIKNNEILNKVKIIELDSFEDHRGEYIETYNGSKSSYNYR